MQVLASLAPNLSFVSESPSCSKPFHIVAFVLDLRVSGSGQHPFNSRFSIPYCSVFLLDLIPIDFQN